MLTGSQHERACTRGKRERVPSLHVNLIRQTDSLSQRIGQRRHDQALQQHIRKDGHADDEVGELF